MLAQNMIRGVGATVASMAMTYGFFWAIMFLGCHSQEMHVHMTTLAHQGSEFNYGN